jgi:hypothetical protein
MTDPRFPIGRFAPPAEFTQALRAGFVEDLAALPGLLGRAVRGLSTDQRQTPYRDGGWTVAQVVHHLADSHMNAYIRHKLTVTERHPTIKPYNEKDWADLADAADPDVSRSLQLIDGLHARWAAFAGRLSAEDFARTMLHPERGPMTLDGSVALYAWHGRHHVAHITSLRERMGW